MVRLGPDARGAEGRDYSCPNAFPSLVAELMSLKMKTQFAHAYLRTELILAALTELFVVRLWSIQSKKKDKRFDTADFNQKIIQAEHIGECSRKHRDRKTDES